VLPFELGVPPTALNTNGFVGVLEDNFLSGDRRAKCEALSSCPVTVGILLGSDLLPSVADKQRRIAFGDRL